MNIHIFNAIGGGILLLAGAGTITLGIKKFDDWEELSALPIGAGCVGAVIGAVVCWIELGIGIFGAK